MPRIKLWLAVTALLASVVFGLSGTAAAANTEDQQLLALVNEQRAAADLPPLVENQQLGTAAQSYADYMAVNNFFAHKGLDGSTLVSRAEAAGYTSWSFLGENLAAGQPTPERVVTAWMKSPTHRANILSSEAHEIGFGLARNASSKYRVYWAMEIGTAW
jgi:uncharacterized protein YkwD